jgi:hypothetical protein
LRGLFFVKGVNEGFFDDFYLKLCAAFEDKFLGLGRQLEAEKKGKCQDILRTYSQSAHQKIEEFKIIELKKNRVNQTWIWLAMIIFGTHRSL